MTDQLHLKDAFPKVEDLQQWVTTRLQDVEGIVPALFYGSSGLQCDETGTRKVTVSAGALYEGIRKYVIAAFNTNTGSEFDTYYRDSGTGFTKVTGQTQWPNTDYDDDSGTLNDMTASYYACLWFYLETDGHVVMLYGRGEYALQADASAETPPDTVPPRMDEHAILIGQYVFQKSGATTSEITNYIPAGAGGTTVTDHGTLSGLSDDDHGQYLLVDGTRELSADWDAGPFDITALQLTADTAVAGEGLVAGASFVGRWIANSGIATFSHTTFQADLSGYALLQASDGDTWLNAETGRTVYFDIGNVQKMSMTSTTLSLSVDVAMGNNDITGVDDIIGNSGSVFSGGDGSNDDLYLHSTTHGTKGTVFVGEVGGSVQVPTYMDLDEVSDPGAPAAADVRLFAHDEHIITIDEDDAWYDLSAGAFGVSSHIHDAITVTDATGLNITWSAGSMHDAYITGGNQRVAIAAEGSNQAQTAASMNFLYFDKSGGVLVNSTTEDNIDFGDGDVPIAAIGTSGNDIIYLDHFKRGYEDTQNLKHTLWHAFQTMVTNGLIVSEHAGAAAFDVDCSAGAYIHLGYDVHNVTSIIDSTSTNIVRWYHVSGVWTTDTNAEINEDYYDDGTDLVEFTGANLNKYWRSTFYIVGDVIHWVYPQAGYANVALAVAASDPTPPDVLQFFPKSTTVILKGSDTAFPSAGGDQWIDVRPILGQVGTAGGSITDHGNLSGLADDDHAKYLLHDGTRALTSNWDAGTFTIRAHQLYADTSTVSQGVTGGSAFMGNWNAGITFAVLCHKDFASTAASFALGQGPTGDTYLNTVSGRVVHFQVNNSDVMAMTSAGLAIGAAAPATSAVLELASTTGALLIPRMTTAQRNALTAANGMIVYDTDIGAFGFYEAGAWVTGSGLT